MKRSGLSLIELLVVIAILGVLVALILPAVQVVRESARRTQCRSNLRQIGLALHNYESTHRMWPAVGINVVSWHVALLPQVDQAAIFKKVQFETAEPATSIRGLPVPVYLCPSDPAPAVFQGTEVAYAATNYLGNSGRGATAHGFDGIFQHFFDALPNHHEGAVRSMDIKDGLSNTAAVSEVLHSVGGYGKERLRIVWNLPKSFDKTEVGQFKEMCQGLPDRPGDSGWNGSFGAHGWRWTFGEIGYSTYNHMLTPGGPSCFNGNQVQLGLYTAASAHGSMANVLFADGHVQPISYSVSAEVWAAIGSRNGSEAVPPSF